MVFGVHWSLWVLAWAIAASVGILFFQGAHRLGTPHPDEEVDLSKFDPELPPSHENGSSEESPSGVHPQQHPHKARGTSISQ